MERKIEDLYCPVCESGPAHRYFERSSDRQMVRVACYCGFSANWARPGDLLHGKFQTSLEDVAVENWNQICLRIE